VLGLAIRVVPADGGLEAAVELAARLAAWPRLAMSTTKRLFHRMADLALAPALEAGRDANVIMRGFRSAAQSDAAA
jgi:enoyl-CoA hydratase/carnithine racemase